MQLAEYDSRGREIPNKTPVALPVGYERPEPLESMIARMIRAHSIQAGKEGKETFEEADDFDVDDDDKLVSQYEFTEMQEEHLNHVRADARAPKAPTETKKEPQTEPVGETKKVDEKAAQ